MLLHKKMLNFRDPSQVEGPIEREGSNHSIVYILTKVRKRRMCLKCSYVVFHAVLCPKLTLVVRVEKLVLIFKYKKSITRTALKLLPSICALDLINCSTASSNWPIWIRYVLPFPRVSTFKSRYF